MDFWLIFTHYKTHFWAIFTHLRMEFSEKRIKARSHGYRDIASPKQSKQHANNLKIRLRMQDISGILCSEREPDYLP